MNLPEFSVKQPVATLMLFLAMVVLGLFSLNLLPVDLYPDIEPPVVSILTSWPGASASDVESEVSKRIEDQVNGVNNLDTLTSKSVDNLSVVSAKFDWGTDLDNATNDLRDRLELARRDLPDDAEQPILYKFSSATEPVMVISVSAGKNWPRLYRIADRQIADNLRRVPGVGAVIIYGGLRRRINVYFDLARLEGYGLGLNQVNQVLASQNINLPAGSTKVGALEYFVRTPGRYTDMNQIKRTVIGNFHGKPVRLADVATVSDDFSPEDLLAWEGKRKAIILFVQKQTGQNTVAVVKAARQTMAKLEKTLPPDVKLNAMIDTAQNIQDSISNLRQSLLSGITLVIIVTLLFLRQLRSAMIIALTIPFSLIVAFILMYFNGYTINMVSMMSLAIVSGMVVDNGIVVLENIVRHIERGGRPAMSAILGAREMGMAITASTATTVVIFLPMMFLTGLVGVFFKQLAFIITVTLAASLFTSLSMTPMLSSLWLKAKRQRPVAEGGWSARLREKSERWFDSVDEAYGRVVDWSLDHRSAVIALSVFSLLSAATMVPFISTSFLPDVDSGDVSVDFRMEEGTRLEETARVIKSATDDILQVVRPEDFKSLYAWSGQSDKGTGVALGFDESPNAASIGFKLVGREKREQSAKQIAQQLRERLQKYAGITRLKVLAVDPAGAILSGSGSKPLVVEVQGPDMDQNVEVASRLATGMAKIHGLVDVAISQKDPRPELWIEVDRDKAAMLGLTAGQVALQARNYLYGYKTSEYRDGGDNYDIFTRFSDVDKDKIESLPRIPLFTADGREIRLKDVAEIKHSLGPIEIERKNLEKVVKVDADLDDISLGQARQEVDKIIAGLELPSGVGLAFGGDVDEQRKAFGDLSILLGLGVLLTYMVMAALFGNLRDPLIIMFSVPFAFVGVIYAYRLSGTTLGVISFMGVIMLVGVVVNNAIVLLDYAKLLLARGAPLREAMVQAGRDRLRPVLMTTLTTFFGMLPMAVSTSTGAEIWNPLGITMLGGLAVSSLITLVLVPTIYYMLEARKRREA